MSRKNNNNLALALVVILIILLVFVILGAGGYLSISGVTNILSKPVVNVPISAKLP
ncbi:MAG: hypothetical protein KGI06_03815 [Candidatus Micrarchaeota archaeon]|nr:hypothetical protein [Candidatus Micrarchaeota archaeon]